MPTPTHQMTQHPQDQRGTAAPSGPLAGVKVIELAGIGPGPFCGMLLADMGADVLRVDRKDKAIESAQDPNLRFDLYGRNKRSVAIDMKHPQGVAAVLQLVEKADILIDPYRPGVLERLGLGPAPCMARNPGLIFGRMTGWGQSGPLAQTAGHDLNYIALMGALHSIGRPGERPVPPLNLIGDFGGGAMYLAFGLMCAYAERSRSGKGQVVDAAMVDGVASLLTGVFGYLQSGRWTRERGCNFLDGGAPYYDVYSTRDGKFVSVAPVEPQFFAELLARLGLDASLAAQQNDRAAWDGLRTTLRELFLTRTRDEWCQLLEGTETCFAPVLDLDEAVVHPHNRERGVFVEAAGVLQPGPAPRMSRTPGQLRSSPPGRGQNTQDALRDWGFTDDAITSLITSGAGWQKSQSRDD